MILNRRSALAGAGGLITALATGEAWAADGPRIRKAASSLTSTSDDVVAFADAVRIMKRRTGALSWDSQNRLHAERAEHGNWRFLPWHRLQLAHMERIISQVSGHPSFAMPYWDWQSDRFLPPWIVDTSSPLYEAQRDPAAATLDFNKARFAESRNVARISSDRFSSFCGRPNAAGRVESYGHNLIHMLVGGAEFGGYMSSTATAALDPIFWLHHCNVDRVWATWHAKNGDSAYSQPWKDTSMSGFTGADGRPTGRWTASRITTTRQLGYSYDSLYPSLVFAVGPGMRPEVVKATSEFQALTTTPRDDGSIRLELPPGMVATLRNARGRVTIEGEGVVAYERSQNLTGRGLQTGLYAGKGRVEMGVSPTFVHFGGEHAAHADYAHVFTLDNSLVQLAQATQGPVEIVTTALDLRPAEGRPPARAVSLEATLTMTEYEPA